MNLICVYFFHFVLLLIAICVLLYLCWINSKRREHSSDDSEANYSQPNVDQTKEQFTLTNIIDQNRSQLTNEEEEKQKHKKITHSGSPYKKHRKVK